MEKNSDNLVYVTHSLANRFKDRIEMNVYLKKYPELHDQILQHELEHTDNTFSKKDFLLDLTGTSKINYFQLFKFMITHPRSLFQLSPIIISTYGDTKKIIYDINQIIIYSIIFIVVIVGLYIGFRV